MITFRRMVPEDADALAVVEEKCFSVPWSREAFWRDASNTDAYYLLAIDTGQNDRIIGIFSVINGNFNLICPAFFDIIAVAAGMISHFFAAKLFFFDFFVLTRYRNIKSITQLKP